MLVCYYGNHCKFMMLLPWSSIKGGISKIEANL